MLVLQLEEQFITLSSSSLKLIEVWRMINLLCMVGAGRHLSFVSSPGMIFTNYGTLFKLEIALSKEIRTLAAEAFLNASWYQGPTSAILNLRGEWNRGESGEEKKKGETGKEGREFFFASRLLLLWSFALKIRIGRISKFFFAQVLF
ncbi:unnamed protein product [Cuscuta epithymum]|uniref:Uncharacterized protein n=1 Tax=Cuscuta epithymum TaxID=186058 RepID=A0AAV0EBL1_9ASTE|nr:unnamed protein product [Cuscuta epithymum]CAH9139363.1 unnamed protein product [Cuscuta epithymum]